MTTAQLIYATIATIDPSLGWRACFGWFKWWLAPVFTEAAVWAATLPAAGQEILTDRVTHVRDGDTIVVGQSAIRRQGVHAPELDEPGGYLPAARTTDTPHPPDSQIGSMEGLHANPLERSAYFRNGAPALPGARGIRYGHHVERPQKISQKNFSENS